MIVLELPWFPPELMPNRSNGVHWAKLKKSKDVYKQICTVLAINAKLPYPPKNGVKFLFYPPDNRKRDLDGCYSALKNAQDCVAHILGVDDTTFRPVSLDFRPKVAGGKIEMIWE